VKFSYRQILASAAGAVLSAVIASVFGVKGTIVGVALGSIAATTGTALAFQSIERTNKAVKQSSCGRRRPRCYAALVAPTRRASRIDAR